MLPDRTSDRSFQTVRDPSFLFGSAYLLMLYTHDMTAEPLGQMDSFGTREIPATEARNRMAELIDAVADGEFVYLTRLPRRVK